MCVFLYLMPSIKVHGAYNLSASQRGAQAAHQALQLPTWGRSWNSSLQIGQGCEESPCETDLCFTCSHSSEESGNGGGSHRPSFCAEVKAMRGELTVYDVGLPHTSVH